MTSDTDLTRSEREMLKAIYRLAKSDGASPDAGAHTGALAGALGVSPGTATAAVKRLADRGLAVHRPYHGVELSGEGRRAAVGAIRRHRIVERFLSDMLGYPWNEADRLAPSFEADLPGEVAERLFVALDRPATCPHGFPIPEPEEAYITQLPPLYALEPGDIAVIAVPGSLAAEIVEFLGTLGLRPGTKVEVIEKHPFDGPLVLRVEGTERVLGERIARQIYVKTEGPDRVPGQQPAPQIQANKES